MFNSADIEAIERATVAAVSPSAVDELDGWLLPFDIGSIGRAKSAVPLRHERCAASMLDAIEARYRARQLPTVFRIPDVAPMEPLRVSLRERGYASAKPTLVMTGSCEAMRGVSDATPAEVSAKPDDAWAGVFLGEGFDSVDGANRVRAFSRAADALFASVREEGKTLAVGVVAFGHGWASVHGMRTVREQRGAGLARRVLAGLALAALDRGVRRVFLQVEEGNAPARALYRRAGFELAWRYVYWSKG